MGRFAECEHHIPLLFSKLHCGFNRKNTIPNFKFVFSTGDKIESGKYKGEIIEMPKIKKVRVTLYF